jgi:Fanconi anemia group M protein
VRFVGQATREESGKGLTQNEQVEILDKFRSGEYNVLVTTSIGEEGLHVPDVDHVIFYEAVPSEIRTIQRRGRTGRTRIGRVTVLMAEDTVDEAYYWSSLRKERRMHSILSMVRARGVTTVKKRTTLFDYT